MAFNKDKPKVITRYISSDRYFDIDSFGIKQNLYLKTKDKKDGEISVICIDNLSTYFDKNEERIYIYGDNLLYQNSKTKTIARADIKVKELKGIKTETEDVLKLIHTSKRHYNITTYPNSNALFQLIMAKKIASISELKLRENWGKYLKRNKQINEKRKIQNK